VRDELQHSKRAKQQVAAAADDPLLPPAVRSTDPYTLMSYLGLPAAAFRPWSPSKGGPPGAGYPPFQPCFSSPGAAVSFSRPGHTNHPHPHHHHQHGGGPVEGSSRCQDSECCVSPVVDTYRRAASSPPLLAALPLKRKHVQEKGKRHCVNVSN